jgi:hypothetical protein
MNAAKRDGTASVEPPSASQMHEAAVSMPNRIAILCDCSGSMRNDAAGKPKIQHERDAVKGFIEACDLTQTSVALVGIGNDLSTPLMADAIALAIESANIQAVSSTPIGDVMQKTLGNYPITRAVLISDGGQTDGNLCFDIAQTYAEAKIPIDCVHISDGEGADTLKRIAEITGGIFIRFSDVASFGKALKYLTPGLRSRLMLPGAANLIGASEVKA